MISATAGQRNSAARPTVQPTPYSRRAAKPTTAPRAPHATTDVTTGIPSTRNPTVDAATMPATTAREPVARPRDAAIGTTAITNSADPTGSLARDRRGRA